MSETYVKVFSSILSSSIWSEDDPTRIVWLTMLAMADRHGYVGASIPGLAAQARVPIEAVERAIEKFLGPDKYSRSPEFEGRRIEVADRGWTLINHERFRDMRDEESRKQYERERKREQRDRAKAARSVPDSQGPPVTKPEMSQMSAHASASASADAEARDQEPPNAPQGAVSAPVAAALAEKPKPKRAEFDSTPTADEQRVIDAINAAAGSRFTATTRELRGALKRDTVDDCLLVVKHLASQPAWQPGGEQAQYLDPITPFRPKAWETRLAKARAWSATRRAAGPVAKTNELLSRLRRDKAEAAAERASKAAGS